MVTKSITIDVEAYDRLKAVQRSNESFSDTIKRVVWNPNRFLETIEKVGKHPLSDASIAAIEDAIAARNPPSPRRKRAK